PRSRCILGGNAPRGPRDQPSTAQPVVPLLEGLQLLQVLQPGLVRHPRRLFVRRRLELLHWRLPPLRIPNKRPWSGPVYLAPEQRRNCRRRQLTSRRGKAPQFVRRSCACPTEPAAPHDFSRPPPPARRQAAEGRRMYPRATRWRGEARRLPKPPPLLLSAWRHQTAP